MADTYRFRVSGHLDDGWSDWFGGLAVQRRDDGTTVLVGPVVDQAALHGVIALIRDLGLPLLSVRRAARRNVREAGNEPQTNTPRGWRPQ
ncbi:MAG: hypothetical protein AB7R89_02835 [Dehalococcoidia bacterium]